MRDVDRLARTQWGLVTHRQLLPMIGRLQIERWRAAGRLIDTHRGVYRLAGSPVTWQQGVAGALTVAPDWAAASHFTAARLLGLAVARRDEIHLTVLKGCAHRRSTAIVHQSDVPGEQIVIAQRLRCTSVERTLADLAGYVNRGQLAHAIDEAVIGGMTTYAKVSEVDMRGRKGGKDLAAVLKSRLPLAEGVQSSIELKVLKAARVARVPQPETQFKVVTKYGPYYIDAAWPAFKIGAEADGFTVHSASKVRHTGDRRRRNELETLGWKMLSFTSDMTIAEVAAVLAANIPR